MSMLRVMLDIASPELSNKTEALTCVNFILENTAHLQELPNQKTFLLSKLNQEWEFILAL
jgi:hypothetical protein